MTSVDAARYPLVIQTNMDGWLNVLNGTVTLDRQAAKAVMNMNDTDLDDFSAWWAANGLTFVTEYMDWLNYEGNERLDIYNMYEYPLTILYSTIDAEKIGETVGLTYDIVSWGMEVLMARWLHESFLPTESMYEDLSLKATISPTSADVNISTAVEYAAYAWETALIPEGLLTGEPCWIWEPVLGDVLASVAQHPYSEYDSYDGLTRMCRAPGTGYSGTQIPYTYPPAAWNLSFNETLTVSWPAGDQTFFRHLSLGMVDTVTGSMAIRYSEPMAMDLPGLINLDQTARTLTFTGPSDMWSWSKDQIKHERLASEWGRLGNPPLREAGGGV